MKDSNNLNNVGFSVLISTYRKCNPKYFNQCMWSIWNDQTLKPNEIVLVQDGPLTDDLYQVIQQWKAILGSVLNIISLEENVGIGGAKNIGFKKCSYEYIAIMDTDDVCLPDRFRDQLDYLLNNLDVDVVGTWISEIDEDNNIIKREVKYPETHEQCVLFFACRDPFAHPTVMYRKSFFKKTKVYYPVNPLLDTIIWHRGFMSGCIFANIPKVHLKFRRTSDTYERRGDMKDLIALLKYRVFHVSPDMNYGIRGKICALLYFLMQLLPPFIKKILYDRFR